MQIRGIEEVSAVAVLGIVGMVAALLIAAVKLCVLPRPESYRAPELVHRPSDVSEPLVGVFDMVFTWGGQVNWTRSSLCTFLSIIHSLSVVCRLVLHVLGHTPNKVPFSYLSEILQLNVLQMGQIDSPGRAF